MKIKHQLISMSKQKGVGMLEVLIALLVLYIGILGLATLQSIGVKYNHQSYHRTQAIMQIYDIADRIRANAPGKAAAYDNHAFAAAPLVLTKDCAAVATACTSGERATYDLQSWRQSIQTFLGPDARGRVNRENAQIHSIEITWLENDLQKNFIYEAQL
jgi:type IV pilus assembly protein PilV